jgi:hypothetical protein
MIKMHKPTWLLAISLLFAMGIGVPGMAQQKNKPVLSVSLSNARLHHKTLSFAWHIDNRSSEPLYVYSTFLNGPPAATTANGTVLQERTSLSATEPVGVNAYPPAKFLRIEPGGVLDGKFVDRQVNLTMLKGITTVEMEVAFGREAEEVTRQVALTSRNGNHPANPIVTWQTEALASTSLTR